MICIYMYSVSCLLSTSHRNHCNATRVIIFILTYYHWASSSIYTYICSIHFSAPKNGVYLTWLPPADSVGDIEFSVTLVQDYHAYWLFYPSPRLKAPDHTTPTSAVVPLRRSMDTLLPWQWALVSVAITAAVMVLTFIISVCCEIRCTGKHRYGYGCSGPGYQQTLVRYWF